MDIKSKYKNIWAYRFFCSSRRSVGGAQATSSTDTSTGFPLIRRAYRRGVLISVDCSPELVVSRGLLTVLDGPVPLICASSCCGNMA